MWGGGGVQSYSFIGSKRKISSLSDQTSVCTIFPESDVVWKKWITNINSTSYLELATTN